MPVYRYPPTEGRKSILPVDRRTTCGQLRRRWIWTTVRLTGVLLPVALFVFYPQVVSVISAGRTVLWAQLFYFALPLTVTLAVAAAAGVAVFVARIVRLSGRRWKSFVGIGGSRFSLGVRPEGPRTGVVLGPFGRASSGKLGRRDPWRISSADH